MRAHTAYIAAIVLALTSSAALAQTVKSDYDPKTDFSKYHSFTGGKGTPAPSPFAEERIQKAIGAQLQSRGFSPTAGDADLVVHTHVQITKEQRVDVNNFGYTGYAYGGWGGMGMGTTTVNVSEIPIGTLLVDMVDAKTNQLVWRGAVSDTISTTATPEKSEQRINKAVAKLFKKFPVPPPKTKK